MNTQISSELKKLFKKHRIVIWYDSKKELRDQFEDLVLAGVEKIALNNNEFTVKYKILRERPEDKFLLYQEGAKPIDEKNWLLDVLLANGEFCTEQTSLWLAELGLESEFLELLKQYSEFFNSAKRRESLRKKLTQSETINSVKLKLLSVCAGSEPTIDRVLENLLAELAEEKDQKIKLISRCKLDSFLWEQLEKNYNYQSEIPGIKDFAIELFKSCYFIELDGKAQLTPEALVFLKRWQDSKKFQNFFEILSNNCAEILSIEKDLNQRDFKVLADLDFFRLIDLKIISDLVEAVSKRTILADECSRIIRQRRQTHWHENFGHIYAAIETASAFFNALDTANLEIESFAEGIKRYSNSWFLIDQLYRKFIYHLDCSKQVSLLERLTEKVENFYSNKYLLRLSDKWQEIVDQTAKWNTSATEVTKQSQFFKNKVQPFLKNNKKVFVIISDALRYEVGDELFKLIRQENKYEAKLSIGLSMLPSYTQMGMAALLPNKELALADNETGTVLVDGQSSQGTNNRTKVLAQNSEKRAVALKADDFIKMNNDESRSFIRDHDLIYFYHNKIDATGDKRETEGQVFEAVEETLKDLIHLIKKLTNANASNILLTADHGFIYQNQELDKSDFSAAEPAGKKLFFRNRRFILGKGLEKQSGLKTYSSKELGLAGDVQVQIPKSINRLRLQGAGSRFVHGGAALQEVVIPILEINKKRKNDISQVEVEIIRGSSTTITAGQLAVTLYQNIAVDDKIKPRALRAGIYNQTGELISDAHNLLFDFPSDNPREREQQVRFILSSQADKENGKDVFLKLEEKEEGTSHYKEYKSIQYTMRRSFTSDFDF